MAGVEPKGTNLWPGVIVGDPLVNNVDKYWPQPNIFRHTWVLEDFHNYTAGDWTLTETQAGATQALTTGHGGLLLLTNTSADNDVNSLQYGTTSFAFTAGRQAWMKFRLTASEATDFEVAVGLMVTDTSPIQSLPSDGVFFYKADDAVTWAFRSRAGSADLQNTSPLGTMTAGTMATIGMYYDGATTVLLFYNGAQVGTISGASFAALFPTADLQLTIASQAGAAAARTLTVDYAAVMMDRFTSP